MGLTFTFAFARKVWIAYQTGGTVRCMIGPPRADTSSTGSATPMKKTSSVLDDRRTAERTAELHPREPDREVFFGDILFKMSKVNLNIQGARHVIYLTPFYL